MITYLYSEVFILTAALDYIPDDTKSDIDIININRLITNLSVNKKFEGHPGQVPYNLAKNDPRVRRLVKSMPKHLYDQM